MEFKISNLSSEAVKKLKSGKEIQIVLTGKVYEIESERKFSFHNVSPPLHFCLGSETTILFGEQDIEIKEKESVEIAETYIECQSHYGFSLKTCNGCALKSQEGCGKIREDIMNFYLGKT